ncbi:MAG: DUF4139 domain-containing protein [Bacteroidetes bacterium]|nr:DUF4139 domain-containing protein [Bacteroidota bacterium]
MKFTTVFALCFSSIISFAQNTKTIKPKPNKATVYLSGAEIAYLESLTLPTGTSEITVEGVSPYLDETSISAYFKGGLVIDTKKTLYYPEQPKKNNNIQKYIIFIERITDSLEETGYLMKDCNNKLSAFAREESLLLNNRLIKGEFAKDSLGLLKASLDLLRARLTNIDEQELILERKVNKLYKIQTALNQRKTYFELLQNDNSDNNSISFNPIHQIIVTIETTQAVTGNLSLKYYVGSAGWMPQYDIQAVSGKDKIQLVYRAQVYQNTGLDWKDVALTLSTSNPTLSNTKPILSEWNLFFGYPNSYVNDMYKNAPVTNYNNLGRAQMNKKSLKLEDAAKDDAELNEIPTVPLFTVNDNFLRTEYEIKTKYSIASDNKAHNVIINNLEIPVSLAYLAVPKLDKDAFLMGKIVDWEDLNLIPAAAKIYFDESYIGTTTIDPVSTKDTLYINLGRDKSIIVKRQNIKEKCKEQTLGEYKTITKTIEITVRNTKGIELDFEIEDQIPITTDPNIKITLIDSDNATYNPVTGKLTWPKNIKPKDTKKVRFTFEVKYPKDKFISGLL